MNANLASFWEMFDDRAEKINEYQFTRRLDNGWVRNYTFYADFVEMLTSCYPDYHYSFYSICCSDDPNEYSYYLEIKKGEFEVFMGFHISHTFKFKLYEDFSEGYPEDFEQKASIKQEVFHWLSDLPVHRLAVLTGAITFPNF